eukprot:13777401-Heterocapsa_arctica.AAC.1
MHHGARLHLRKDRVHIAKGYAEHHQRGGETSDKFHHENFKHKMRGQHPDTVDSWKDYEIMGDGEPVYEDWPWIGES